MADKSWWSVLISVSGCSRARVGVAYVKADISASVNGVDLELVSSYLPGRSKKKNARTIISETALVDSKANKVARVAMLQMTMNCRLAWVGPSFSTGLAAM